MSKKFKVNVIAHQLKGKKIAKYGDVISESELTTDSKTLLKQGFIIEVESDDTAIDAEAKKVADAEVKKVADADPVNDAAKKLQAKTNKSN